MCWILHIYVLFCVLSRGLTSEYRLVNTENGIVRGYKARDGEYIAYLGMPYAAPPIGENRFKAPKTASRWTGIYEANHTVECPQRESLNEDCLVINVFTPLNIKGKSLSVLFYIHGGAYIFGKGPTKGVEPLVEKDVIVVTFNYRLGALGFLCLSTDFARGNAGLKDQVAALKWMQRNIKNFGGNTKQVTIYGSSAGASSVELLLLFKNENVKYFNKTIMESGSALDVWAIDKYPLKTATVVYFNAINSNKVVNTNNHVTRDLEEFYRRASPSTLNKATLAYYNSLTDGTFGFAPCIEKSSNSIDEQFITMHPRQKLYKQDYTKVPMMVLYSTLEGLFVTNDKFHKINNIQTIFDNFHNFMPADLKFDTVNTGNKVAKLVKHFYFKTTRTQTDENKSLLKFLGDTMILNGIIESICEHVKNSTLYLMEFSYKGELGYDDEIFTDINVAGHAEVKFYSILNRQVRTNDDKLMVDKVSNLVTNFVKLGNPTPSPTKLLPFTWPPARQEKLTYLLLDREWRLLDNPYPDRMDLWRRVYEKFGD